MQVKINGKPEEVREETVLQLLKARNIEPQMVTVELNSKILQKEELVQIHLKEGDELEFLFFMGGGVDRFAPNKSPRKAV
jgi:sulfur carrier protein